jgi:hypothetical protein
MVPFVHSAQQAVKWQKPASGVENHWPAFVEIVLRISSREILDDPEEQRTAAEARTVLDEGKRTRKDGRYKLFKMVRDDANAAMELCKMQVGNSHSLLSLLKKMNANFEVLTTTMKMRASALEAHSDCPQLAEEVFVQPNSNHIPIKNE